MLTKVLTAKQVRAVRIYFKYLYSLADGGWYRAQILEIPLPKEVKVCYVDFGNCERVRLDDIKILAPAFYNNPVQAMKCRLNRAKEKWNASECESFEVLVLEQQLIARVKSIGKI